MKLRTKLILSFTIVVILVGGIGITFSYINQSVKDKVTSESEEAIREVNLVGEMTTQLFRSITQMQYLLGNQYRKSLSMNFSRSEKSPEALNAELDSTLNRFKSSFSQMQKLVKKDSAKSQTVNGRTARMISLLDRLQNKFQIYASLTQRFQQLSSKNYEDGKEFFTVTIEPFFRSNLIPLIEDVRRETKMNHEQKIASLNDRLDKTSSILGFATLAALVITIIITSFLYRSIANPVQRIAQAAQKIGQGNLDERIDYHSNDELGQLSNTFDEMVESLQETTVSRDYVDSIIEAMADLLVVTDKNYNITRVNSAGATMVDKQEDELLGRPLGTIFDELPEDLLQDSSAEGIKSRNAKLFVEETSEIPVSVSKGTIKDKSGAISGYVIVASDISSEIEARKKISESLKEKEILISEIHHRVKNNLAVISGLIEMQLWQAENKYAVSALQQSQLRVQSIALVHKKLYQTDNLSFIKFKKYSRELLNAIRNTYLSEDSDIDISLHVDDLALNINQAIPCSLLINELVVNALKHAFEDSSKGTIEVTLQKDDSHIILRVQDNGRGFDEDPQVDESLGLTLVSTLSKQLDAELSFKNDNGAFIEVKFTAEDVVNS
ncbi:PAS domain S-box-containing protein [Fodinibius salinus]|uniref:histidine kinase n=1 Tax=Fodinibius salinus TaxID=860790 RepID=A0A5D3YQ95_9BACT|nr:histidine kinase dimerization/phosphoacceptor domain -containing protein [Fodinibius salinus]TYP94721.1 PAS domain S-box-containing protein [Fodinibius salinus]